MRRDLIIYEATAHISISSTFSMEKSDDEWCYPYILMLLQTYCKAQCISIKMQFRSIRALEGTNVVFILVLDRGNICTLIMDMQWPRHGCRMQNSQYNAQFLIAI